VPPRKLWPSWIKTQTVERRECSVDQKTYFVRRIMGRVMPSARQTDAAMIAKLKRNRRPPRRMSSAAPLPATSEAGSMKKEHKGKT